MKILSLRMIACLTMFTLIASSCGPKRIDEDEVDWKEMDEFHMLMAESFHPYRDSADLAPVFQYASAMDSLAGEWLKTELPERVNNDNVKTALKELKAEAEKLHGFVTSGDTAQVGTSLEQLHNIFHHLQESWYSAAGEHDSDEGHH